MGVVVNSLVVDIGNSRSKAGVFIQGKLLKEVVLNHADELIDLIQAHLIKQSILLQTGKDILELLPILVDKTQFFKLDASTQLPFKNHYATPETLGADRLAAVAGARHLFPDNACLVFDAGTCLTADFIDAAGIYQGGAISPGYLMRLRAMHEMTHKLPLLAPEETKLLTGANTTQSMLSGAFIGMLGEINDRICRYQETYGEINVLICGGDAELFGKHIKKPIFANPQLVLHGLYQILIFNAH